MFLGSLDTERHVFGLEDRWCAGVCVCVCEAGKCSGRVGSDLCKCAGVSLTSYLIFRRKFGMSPSGGHACVLWKLGAPYRWSGKRSHGGIAHSVTSARGAGGGGRSSRPVVVFRVVCASGRSGLCACEPESLAPNRSREAVRNGWPFCWPESVLTPNRITELVRFSERSVLCDPTSLGENGRRDVFSHL